MSAFRPQATKTSNLPHLSCIAWKPEPLGTEFKCCACSKTGLMLHLEIQKGKAAVARAKSNANLQRPLHSNAQWDQPGAPTRCMGFVNATGQHDVQHSAGMHTEQETVSTNVHTWRIQLQCSTPIGAARLQSNSTPTVNCEWREERLVGGMEGSSGAASDPQ